MTADNNSFVRLHADQNRRMCQKKIEYPRGIHSAQIVQAKAGAVIVEKGIEAGLEIHEAFEIEPLQEGCDLRRDPDSAVALRESTLELCSHEIDEPIGGELSFAFQIGERDGDETEVFQQAPVTKCFLPKCRCTRETKSGSAMQRTFHCARVQGGEIFRGPPYAPRRFRKADRSDRRVLNLPEFRKFSFYFPVS